MNNPAGIVRAAPDGPARLGWLQAALAVAAIAWGAQQFTPLLLLYKALLHLSATDVLWTTRAAASAVTDADSARLPVSP
jgi:hypothetical protein